MVNERFGAAVQGERMRSIVEEECNLKKTGSCLIAEKRKRG
jgi:hypothetical protein